jgi:hypothetical protein
MDGWVNEWQDGWMGVWVDGWVGRWMAHQLIRTFGDQQCLAKCTSHSVKDTCRCVSHIHISSLQTPPPDRNLT